MVNCLLCLPPRDITTWAPSSWQTLHNAFELSPSTISKHFQTQLLRDWAIALPCVVDATDLVSHLRLLPFRTFDETSLIVKKCLFEIPVLIYNDRFIL